MNEKNIIEQLFLILNLTFGELDVYFNELKFKNTFKEDGHLIYVSKVPKTGFYSLSVEGEKITYCSFTIVGKLNSTQLVAHAISNYEFVNIPINEANSFILDNENYRLSIRLINHESLFRSAIVLMKRDFEFGYIPDISFTMEAPPPLKG